MTAQPKSSLEQLLHHLGFANVTVEEHHLEEGLLLDVKSDDAGRLIGRQGQTLGELQYILNRMLFHQDQDAPKVMLDVSGYRASARDALVKKAKEAAEKVRRWGDIVELEPMNANVQARRFFDRASQVASPDDWVALLSLLEDRQTNKKKIRKGVKKER